MAEPVQPALPVNGDEFFIGWLPPPASYARFLRPIALGLIMLAGAVAIFIALSQRSPGTAQWEGDVRSLEGVAYAAPYAMLRVRGANDADPVRTFLLAEEGKFGAADRIRPFDGRPVKVTGTLLHRDDRRMFELAEGETGIQLLTTMNESERALLRRPPAQLVGQVKAGR